MEAATRSRKLPNVTGPTSDHRLTAQKARAPPPSPPPTRGAGNSVHAVSAGVGSLTLEVETVGRLEAGDHQVSEAGQLGAGARSRRGPAGGRAGRRRTDTGVRRRPVAGGWLRRGRFRSGRFRKGRLRSDRFRSGRFRRGSCRADSAAADVSATTRRPPDVIGILCRTWYPSGDEDPLKWTTKPQLRARTEFWCPFNHLPNCYTHLRINKIK